MSEPFIERLIRFTPHGGELDRDALLFAAGRSSARPNRTWIALTAALACTQTLTLALMLMLPFWRSQTAPSTSPTLAPVIAQPTPPEPPREDSLTPDPFEHSTLWTARQRLLDLDFENHLAPPDSGSFVDPEPPLRAFGTPTSSISN